MAEPGDSIGLANVNTADFNQLMSMFDGDSLSNIFPSSEPVAGAELEILEQPKQRGFRFRYSCEGPSHGGLPGERSAKGRKSYPSVQINNYCGNARIEVTLVTVSDPPQPHAHSLVGKNVRDGACIVEVGAENGMTASFPNLGIQHVTKKNVKTVLRERYLQKRRLEKSFTSGTSSGNEPQPMNVDDARAGPSHEATDKNVAEAITKQEMHKIDQMVEQEAKNMNLSTVRLCFQTYLPNEHGHFVNCLKPVYSHPIFDSKAASASELKICRIDRQSGFVNGGEEVFLLCDKVQKDDIEVRFFEPPENGRDWEAFGKFSTSDVHRQFAIVFKTPEYWNNAIEKPVTVNIELRRKSDQETSAPVDFTYKPTEFDPEQIGAKRRKKVPHFSEFEQGGLGSGMGSDFGASTSGAEGGAAASSMFQNPFSFSNFGVPAMNFPSFSGLPAFYPPFPPVGSLPGGFGNLGGESPQQQYQPPSDQEPSESNVS